MCRFVCEYILICWSIYEYFQHLEITRINTYVCVHLYLYLFHTHTFITPFAPTANRSAYMYTCHIYTCLHIRMSPIYTYAYNYIHIPVSRFLTNVWITRPANRSAYMCMCHTYICMHICISPLYVYAYENIYSPMSHFLTNTLIRCPVPAANRSAYIYKFHVFFAYKYVTYMYVTYIHVCI